MKGAWPWSGAVVRRAGEDGGGAVELFGKHDADQHVGPDHLAQGQPELGCIAQVGIEAVGTTDNEGQVLLAGVAPVGEFFRELG